MTVMVQPILLAQMTCVVGLLAYIHHFQIYIFMRIRSPRFDQKRKCVRHSSTTQTSKTNIVMEKHYADKKHEIHVNRLSTFIISVCHRQANVWLRNLPQKTLAILS